MESTVVSDDIVESLNQPIQEPHSPRLFPTLDSYYVRVTKILFLIYLYLNFPLLSAERISSGQFSFPGKGVKRVVA